MVQMIQKEGNLSPSTIAVNFVTPAKEWTEGDAPIVPNHLTDTFDSVANDVEKDLANEVQNVLEDAGVHSRAEETIDASVDPSVDGSHSSSESGRSESEDTKKIDIELNTAVQRALNHPDAEADATFDEESVVSASLSVSSTKSAVQSRLESRTKPDDPTIDAFDAKMEAANRRRLLFLQNISGKVEQQLEKISNKRTSAVEKKDTELMELKKKHDQKLSNAVQRKEYFLQSIAGNAESELKKVSSVRSIVEEQKVAIQKKHNDKLARAGERKEYFQQNKTSQLKSKNEKISNTKNIIAEKQDAEVVALKLRHNEKLANAAERKEYFLKSISGKSEAELGKISTARITTEEQQEAEVQALKKRHDEKLADATKRKEYFLQIIAGKSEAELEKIAIARITTEEQKEAGVQALKKKHDEKLVNASERKEYFLKGISGKSGAQLEKIATARSAAEEQQDLEVKALKRKHDEKLARAAERKEYFIKSISEKSEAQLEKVTNARITTEEKKEADVLALKKKHDEKIAIAAKRKEQLLQSNSGKVEAKLEKVSNAKSIAEEERLAEIKKKHDQKSSDAAERKERFLQNISGKAEAKFEKVQSARSVVEEKKDAEVQSISKKHDTKLSKAAERKEYFLQSKTSSFRSKMERFVSTKMLLTSENTDNKISKDELDRKLSSAAERKQAILEQKKNRVSAYLESTLNRGQEALRRKRLRPDDSIQMVEGLDELEDAGLMWLPDDSSVAASISSTASSKSAVQIRLENYKRSTPTREKMEAKIQAARERREKAIALTQEKAGFKAKMDKISNKMRSAELAVKDLSDRVSRKMILATKRREEYMEDSIGGKSLQERKKIQIAQKRNAEKAKKVSVMQQKLEDKLLSALERKERILHAKSAKAAGDVSISSRRGQAALDKKDATVEQLKQKSMSKLVSAQRRRQGLRKLEKEKKEVMMLRREMARSVDQETRMVSVQDMLKSRAQDKLQAAEERRARIAEEERKKHEARNKRRQAALELARQRKVEAEQIAAWSSPSKDETESLKPVPEVEEELNEPTVEEPSMTLDQDNVADEEGSFNERRLMAKQQLVEEIRLANEVKYNELDRIRREMKTADRPGPHRESSGMSFGTIESTEMLSFDEGDVSISGLSTVREEESEADRKKAQAALALAELDIKLSEIQLLQAMLLAEEASLSGAEEFKTCEKSVQELDQVKLSAEKRRGRFQLAPKNFFAQTMKKAREATNMAGRRLEDIRRNVNAHDKNTQKSRQKTVPSLVNMTS